MRVYVPLGFPNNSHLVGEMGCFVIYPAIWLDALSPDSHCSDNREDSRQSDLHRELCRVQIAQKAQVNFTEAALRLA
ncbi:hypothetical protein PGT21_007057 [Puccinia graminis f. sp. tritici]|uniref:Uncharacterized protein n=1 Tax=Puccinia graminis f. sp. tritici TaxID=56615 RepID=A0A5B0R021_PUCGR|nr:hypothetical protein PGT21_007057 [Puccinia graminis f. sp. tritici]